MTSSLVGSEMCIRDRSRTTWSGRMPSLISRFRDGALLRSVDLSRCFHFQLVLLQRVSLSGDVQGRQQLETQALFTP
eukprot:6641619-Prorocentrum_lima.AAC.1